jgi:hypothetical protein
MNIDPCPARKGGALRPSICSTRRPHYRRARNSATDFSEVGDVSDEVKARPCQTGPSPRLARLARRLISSGDLLGTVDTTHPNLRGENANIPALHSYKHQAHSIPIRTTRQSTNTKRYTATLPIHITNVPRDI